MKNYKKEIIFYQGSFDLLHWGQIRAIQRAKKSGDYLIIGLNTDRLVQEYKDRPAVIPYTYRKKMLEALRAVDRVVPASMRHPLALLKSNNIDVYVMCEEWIGTKDREIKYMEAKGGKVVVLPYLKTISATDIRRKITENYLLHSIKLCPKCQRKI